MVCGGRMLQRRQKFEEMLRPQRIRLEGRNKPMSTCVLQLFWFVLAARNELRRQPEILGMLSKDSVPESWVNTVRT